MFGQDDVQGWRGVRMRREIVRALFCDLDGTLIYSHRVALAGEKLCVERLEGREQSFMTRKSFASLSRERDFLLAPLTTRSPEQFARLEGLMGALRCRDALVCNGGMLLRDGAPDASWLEETRELAGHELRTLPEALRLLRESCGESNARDVAGLMAYAKSERPGELAQSLRHKLDDSGLRVMCDRCKVYCIPRSINKGLALARYRAREGIDFAAACGDSEFDLPMLEVADLAILPVSLAPNLRNPRRLLIRDDRILSNQLCELLERGEVFPK